ncbi:hypothetical protein [Sphingobium bisphenolivorans]|uniref:hypothetical protein n=1 Tax=Sphingobium bisphenolivorans TaxID=1335760 RepID=UPI0003A30560|nr:hypothetical protein [Sphingobium bisphenolivorans]
MATRPYEIAYDDNRKLLRITLAGLWDLPTAHSYLEDLRRQEQRIGLDLDQLSVLIDMREHAIQPREVADLLTDSLKDAGRPGRTTASIVSSSALKVLQIKRISEMIERNELFTTEADALAWLAAQAAKQGDRAG